MDRLKCLREVIKNKSKERITWDFECEKWFSVWKKCEEFSLREEFSAGEIVAGGWNWVLIAAPHIFIFLHLHLTGTSTTAFSYCKGLGIDSRLLMR